MSNAEHRVLKGEVVIRRTHELPYHYEFSLVSCILALASEYTWYLVH